MTRKDRVAIAGIGETEVGSLPGKSLARLQFEAASAALVDAGIDRADVDGLITTVPRAAPLVWHGNDLAEQLGLKPDLVLSLAQGGASVLVAVEYAALAIAAHKASAILIVSCDKMLTGLGRDQAVSGMAESVYREFEVPYGPTVPVDFALMARRHMHQFGTTPEQLASVAVAMRTHAGLNPKASKREPITVDDVLASRLIASPLHLLDCSLISDGGAALVVTSSSDTPTDKGVVEVLAVGEGHNPEMAPNCADLTALDCCRVSGDKAFRQAEISPAEIDIAFIYDPFTIAVIVALEDLGFCAKGEGGPFVESGAIELGGRLPVNPHGGLLSYAHPGRPGALLHFVEAVRQLRGDAGDRQVPGARRALIAAEGARLGMYASLILEG